MRARGPPDPPDHFFWLARDWDAKKKQKEVTRSVVSKYWGLVLGYTSCFFVLIIITSKRSNLPINGSRELPDQK